MALAGSAKRIASINEAAGLPGDWPVPADQRAQIRTTGAREFFVNEYGRQPEDARELAGLIARHSRPKTQAVAGYNLTFSPVKSVPTLWALADPQVAARIEVAHQCAVKDALAFIENHALYTREGTNGVRQVNVQGIVATAFTHRDSRAGDPDLHTHVAVANKVQTKDGRWLSIDVRVLFKATVAASERYNTSLERRLRTGLGLRFEERANADARKRPVREVVGVDPALNQRWSALRASIQARHCELVADIQAAHGRPPTPVESLHLAQQSHRPGWCCGWLTATRPAMASRTASDGPSWSGRRRPQTCSRGCWPATTRRDRRPPSYVTCPTRRPAWARPPRCGGGSAGTCRLP